VPLFVSQFPYSEGVPAPSSSGPNCREAASANLQIADNRRDTNCTRVPWRTQLWSSRYKRREKKALARCRAYENEKWIDLFLPNQVVVYLWRQWIQCNRNSFYSSRPPGSKAVAESMIIGNTLFSGLWIGCESTHCNGDLGSHATNHWSSHTFQGGLVAFSLLVCSGFGHGEGWHQLWAISVPPRIQRGTGRGASKIAHWAWPPHRSDWRRVSTLSLSRLNKETRRWEGSSCGSSELSLCLLLRKSAIIWMKLYLWWRTLLYCDLCAKPYSLNESWSGQLYQFSTQGSWGVHCILCLRITCIHDPS
jgi:hypothetical protein